MRAILVGLLFVGVATAGPPLSKTGGKSPTDYDQIQGEWVVVEVETADGVSTHSPYEKELGTTVVFEGDAFRMVEGGKVLPDWSKVTFTLDPTAETKTFDLHITKGKERTTGTGIYSLEGGTLVVYLGRVRPKDLSAKPNKSTCDAVLRMKRPLI